MDILHLGKYYPPYHGGVETAMAAICEGLAEAGEAVTALVANDGPTASRETRAGVAVTRMARTRVWFSQPICPALGPTLAASRQDILHVHLPNPLAAWHCLRRRPPGRWLALYHSDIVKQRLLAHAANVVVRRFLDRCAAITVPSLAHVDHSPVLKAYRARCHVIPFGLDPTPFRQPGPDWDDRLPPDWRDRPLLLFVGRLVYYKGVDVLLEALTRLPEARLVVVGKGPLAGSLQAQARGAGLEGRVAWLSDLPVEALATLLRAARTLVLPSTARSEMFGMVQLEAFAAGRPVVSTDLPTGVPWVNRHGETGLVVPPGDAVALAEALGRLVADADLARGLDLALALVVPQGRGHLPRGSRRQCPRTGGPPGPRPARAPQPRGRARDGRPGRGDAAPAAGGRPIHPPARGRSGGPPTADASRRARPCGTAAGRPDRRPLRIGPDRGRPLGARAPAAGHEGRHPGGARTRTGSGGTDRSSGGPGHQSAHAAHRERCDRQPLGAQRQHAAAQAGELHAGRGHRRRDPRALRVTPSIG